MSNTVIKKNRSKNSGCSVVAPLVATHADHPAPRREKIHPSWHAPTLPVAGAGESRAATKV